MTRRHFRKPRMRVTLLLSVLLASLTVPAGASHAGAADDAQRVETYVLPVNAEVFDLDQLRQPLGLSRLRQLSSEQDPQALLPRETIGPAKGYAPRATEDSAQPVPVTRSGRVAAAVSLPEPAHTMTPADCVLGLATSQFYVKSRFAVCSGRQFQQVWLKNGEPVGTSRFDVLAIGTIAQNSRTVNVEYHFRDFTAAGVHNAPGMGITTKGSIAQSWPSTAQYAQGGVAMPTTRTWAQLLLASSFTHTVTAAAGQGSNGATDSVFAVYEPNITLKAAPGWVMDPITGGNLFLLPPRWEKAGYLPASATGAAVFSILPTLQYSTGSDAPERGVAQHIQRAFTNPGSTVPPIVNKSLPGNSTDAPLTRLYADTTRRDENRNRAVYNCQKWFGRDYTEQGTKECDEYPFASTYEGAALSNYDPTAEPGNFSVLPVIAKENGAAGILLAQFYDKNRLIDGPDDGFLVQIIP